jgi:hypothetical protein
MLEETPTLQEAVLSVHHAYIHTLSSTGACKIIENHSGVAFIQAIQQVVVQGVGSEQGQIAVALREPNPLLPQKPTEGSPEQTPPD